MFFLKEQAVYKTFFLNIYCMLMRKKRNGLRPFTREVNMRVYKIIYK